MDHQTTEAVLSLDRESGTWHTSLPKIEGIPLVDGAYWYYKLGEKIPCLVLVGEYKGTRAIKDGGCIQRYWLSGEFFVGPIQPPYATPEELANPSEDEFRKAYENRCTLDEHAHAKSSE